MFVGVAPFTLSFHFCHLVVMEIVVSSCENDSIDIWSDRNLWDLEYSDNFVLLTEDPSKLPVFLDCLNDGAGRFGMRFAPSNCKMLQYWMGFTRSRPFLLLVSNRLR